MTGGPDKSSVDTCGIAACSSRARFDICSVYMYVYMMYMSCIYFIYYINYVCMCVCASACVAYGHAVAHAGVRLADACESVCGRARGSVWV